VRDTALKWVERMLGQRFAERVGGVGWRPASDDWKFVGEFMPIMVAIATTPLEARTADDVLPPGTTRNGWIVMSAAHTATLLLLALMLRYQAADLSNEDHNVLFALQRRGPQPLDGLCAILNKMPIFGSDLWTDERLTRTLETLRAKRVRDGTIPLVDKRVDGTWRLNREIYR
jgi:hypothetical protein